MPDTPWPHPNVPLGIFFTMLITMRSSLAIAFDAYVLEMPHGTNTMVGIMEGVAGCAAVFCMALGAVVADMCRRVYILRVAALTAVSSGVVTVVTLFVLYPQHHETVTFIGLCVAQALGNIGRAFSTSGVEALFGDSTPKNARSRWYARKAAAYTLGLASGPLVAVSIFLGLSNTWTRNELTVVMCASAGFSLLVAATALAFRDVVPPLSAGSDHLLPDNSQASEQQPREEARSHEAPETSTRAAGTSPGPVNATIDAAAAVRVHEDDGSEDTPRTPAWGWSCCCGVRTRHVPCTPRTDSTLNAPYAAPLKDQRSNLSWEQT